MTIIVIISSFIVARFRFFFILGWFFYGEMAFLCNRIPRRGILEMPRKKLTGSSWLRFWVSVWGGKVVFTTDRWRCTSRSNRGKSCSYIRCLNLWIFRGHTQILIEIWLFWACCWFCNRCGWWRRRAGNRSCYVLLSFCCCGGAPLRH